MVLPQIHPQVEISLAWGRKEEQANRNFHLAILQVYTDSERLWAWVGTPNPRSHVPVQLTWTLPDPSALLTRGWQAYFSPPLKRPELAQAPPHSLLSQ